MPCRATLANFWGSVFWGLISRDRWALFPPRLAQQSTPQPAPCLLLLGSASPTPWHVNKGEDHRFRPSCPVTTWPSLLRADPPCTSGSFHGSRGKRGPLTILVRFSHQASPCVRAKSDTHLTPSSWNVPIPPPPGSLSCSSNCSPQDQNGQTPLSLPLL